MSHLEKLADHLAWADQLCLDSLRRCRTPLPAAIGLYEHVIAAESTWLSRIDGAPQRLPIWPEIPLDECEAASRVTIAKLRSLVSGLKPEDLERQITYRNSARAQFTTGLEDILLHVFLHGSYHRGQVAALLRSAGESPNPTDYIAWVRGAPAATRSNA